ncbi:Sec-independent protein translocase protein TatB [Haliea sp. E1-2-M8]|uniref:Sec-independent protein translocase protein TatB n=1 Tax=Haliea sp. E1-2-M8 TaxID=3064706 RepID=UPI0027275599|nr:Sec-independent protein translocase protein TatB [Haliea sp. E1-2-M8]MDO8860960.1 Sec-independent protein translocase protein TatB [Haliea sp. E1-2-M8]
MFDIGFTELIIIAVVSLLVVGPEKLPGAIRTGSAWLHRIRRGFNDIRQEVEQELHNDAVLQELRKTRDEIKTGVENAKREFQDDDAAMTKPADEAASGTKAGATPAPGQEPPGQ